MAFAQREVVHLLVLGIDGAQALAHLGCVEVTEVGLGAS
jgi:hypothetical protein